MSTRALWAAALAITVACSRPDGERPDARVAAWRDDLRTLATELPARHKNAFHHIAETDWRRAVDDLDRAIPTLDDAHVIARLAQLVAKIGDAHTTLWPRTKLGVYPLRLVWFDDGIFVVGASPDHASEVGTKLVGIGGYTIDDVIARTTPLVAHDNDAGLRGTLPFVLTDPGALAGVDLASGDRATFKLMAGDGNVHELELHPVATAPNITRPTPLPLQLSGPNTNYWNTYVEADHLLYFGYNACANDPRVGSFASFVDSTLAFADQHPIDRFVIDLRKNGGGNSSLLEPLLDGLAKRPELARRVFVIIGMHTFSSAVLNAMELKRQLHATLVGGPTAGSPSHYGEVRNFELPHSRLSVQYATKFFAYPDFAGDAVQPDLPVKVTSADWFAGRDPALDAIRAASPR